MGKGKSHFKCTICGTEIEVPLCCGKEMAVVDGELRCSLCNSAESIPLCCGKENVMVTQESGKK